MLRHATTREEYVAALTFACCGMLKFTKLLDHQLDQSSGTVILKNHHLIMTTYFKVISTGEVPYTSLVLGKNNNFDPQEQNFGD